MNIVYTVRSESPQAPLAQLLHLPLGLDIWQVRGDHVVLRAGEAQAARLRQIGYTTEELVETETHISTFATEEAIAAYHSAETLDRRTKHPRNRARNLDFEGVRTGKPRATYGRPEALARFATSRRLNEAGADVSRGQRQPASTVEQLPAQGDAPEKGVCLGPESSDAGDMGRSHARSGQPAVKYRPRETGVNVDSWTRDVHRSVREKEPSVRKGSR